MRDVRYADKNIKVKTFFFITKMLHEDLLKKEDILSADSQHWIDMDG